MRAVPAHCVARVNYRAAIEEFFRRHPAATQHQARRATGAPKTTVRYVYWQLVEAKKVNSPGRGRPPVLSMSCSP